VPLPTLMAFEVVRFNDRPRSTRIRHPDWAIHGEMEIPHVLRIECVGGEVLATFETEREAFSEATRLMCLGTDHTFGVREVKG